MFAAAFVEQYKGNKIVDLLFIRLVFPVYAFLERVAIFGKDLVILG